MVIIPSGIKVGVFGGGVSCEREISLISAKEAFSALERKGIKATLVDIFTRDKEKIKKLILSEGIDLAFIALHGEFGEDGKIQEILEELAIPYTGSGPLASYLAMDKISSKQIFLKEGISTARFVIWENDKFLSKNIKYPTVVKPYFAGSSLGVSIVWQEHELKGAIEKALSIQDKIILEDYIDGRELTVGILGEKPLAVIEIVPKKGYFDFSSKYSDGLTEFIAPAKLEEDIYRKVQEIGLKAHQALGCRNFSRVDIRLDKSNIPYVLEVNSIPGLTSHSLLPLSAKCCGIGFDDLMLEMVSLALHEKKYIQKA
jgi:D-alanine-D-alanine ligase